METALLVIFTLIPLAGLIFVWYFVSRDFARIAADKGYSDKRYFHYCFWLGLVGILMVVSMPDKKGRTAPVAPVTPEKAQSQPPVPVSEPVVPRRTPEEAAAVPVAFAREHPVPKATPAEQPAATAPAAKGDPSPATNRRSSKAAAPKAPTTWKCTCRALNPIDAPTCEKCKATWRCTCGKVNPRNEARCGSCWFWRCSCGKINPPSKGMCEACNAAKPR